MTFNETGNELCEKNDFEEENPSAFLVWALNNLEYQIPNDPSLILICETIELEF